MALIATFLPRRKPFNRWTGTERINFPLAKDIAQVLQQQLQQLKNKNIIKSKLNEF